VRWQPQPTKVRTSLHAIPKGYSGTLKTVGHMRNLIRQGAKDFHIRQTAIDILFDRDVKPKDYIGEIRALFEWVQQNIRYTRDTFGVEVLHSARRMLELRAGDCDDLSILLGSMLESIGHPVRLVLTGSNPLRPAFFTHVYIEASHRNRWIPLDATMTYPMGWAPRTPVRQVFGLEGPGTREEQMEFEGFGAPVQAPDWLKGLVHAVRGESLRPKDARVKTLWNLLRQRQLLHKDPWLKAVLYRIWYSGLPARPRPHTSERMVSQLRNWGILPSRLR